MAITKQTKEYIEGQIEYYINEALSYKQIAENYTPEVKSISDTTFGIIAGCIYSSFLQVYQNQQQTAELDDIKEFNQILKENAGKIKQAIEKADSKTED